MSSNLHRIQQAIDVAAKNNRKIAFVGRSIEQNIRTAEELGFLHLPKNPLNKRKIKDMPPNQVCVIIAGSQGQVGSSLERAAKNDHNLVTIDPQDKVVFATEPIPGNEVFLYDAIDNLSKLGVEIAYPDIRDETLHVSGHGNADELMRLVSLTKPKYLMPIGGAYRHMVQYKKLVIGLGYEANRIHVLDTGNTLMLENGQTRMGKNVKLKDVIVDGTGIGDVGYVVLSDRRKMAENGIVVVVVLISKKTGKIIGQPEVISRGLVYMKNAKKLINTISQKTSQVLPKQIGQKNWAKLRPSIEKSLQKLIYKEIQRSPLILPVVREV